MVEPQFVITRLNNMMSIAGTRMSEVCPFMPYVLYYNLCHTCYIIVGVVRRNKELGFGHLVTFTLF